VLVVEDEPALRELIAGLLTEAGFAVVEAGDGDVAVRQVRSAAPSIVLLDLGLPGGNGLDLLRSLRDETSVPVIVVSGRGDEVNRVRALDLGADDFVGKPFSGPELLARVRAVLRRVAPAEAAEQADDGVLRHGSLVIDRRAREVRCDGRVIPLAAREFDLLAFLAASPRRVFSREELLAEVWRSRPEWQDPTTVKEHVRRIRLKLEPDPEAPRWLVTVRGVGYRFDP
jgi:DNA-binding response OmpR family regulator